MKIKHYLLVNKNIFLAQKYALDIVLRLFVVRREQFLGVKIEENCDPQEMAIVKYICVHF